MVYSKVRIIRSRGYFMYLDMSAFTCTLRLLHFL